MKSTCTAVYGNSIRPSSSLRNTPAFSSMCTSECTARTSRPTRRAASRKVTGPAPVNVCTSANAVGREHLPEQVERLERDPLLLPLTRERMSLQLPSDELRHHYVRTKVRVHRYVDGTLGVFHGPRKLAAYDAKGTQTITKEVLRAAA